LIFFCRDEQVIAIKGEDEKDDDFDFEGSPTKKRKCNQPDVRPILKILTFEEF
jgi:hypothetical protein